MANEPQTNTSSGQRTLPVLPLRNTVLFPFVTMPIAVGRPRSMEAIEAAVLSEDKRLLVFTQRDAAVDDPDAAGLFEIGTEAVIKQMGRGPNGLNLILQGVERVRRVGAAAAEVRSEEASASAEKSAAMLLAVESVPLPEDEGPEVEALQREIASLASRFHELGQPDTSLDFAAFLSQFDNPMQLAWLLAALISPAVEKAQQILEAETRVSAFRLLHEELTREVQILELRRDIATQAESEIDDEQKRYVLRKQLRAIQKELGEDSPEQADAVEMRLRMEGIELPEAVRKECDREIQRLESLPAAAPEYQVLKSHLELILELPWDEHTTDNLDLKSARRVLDEDHFGLPDVKERILEQLAVLRLNPDAQAPILCFVGPPGVGKTSLGQSIARALGRKFERFSLGALHDEAELRGHRRTYIGAMPGRIIQAIRRAGARNPLIMLDEVDKLGKDYRGDPASALLEILDPAQNATFRDNYLDLPFDLSKVFFILTANTLDTMPRPLLDRVETIPLSGYSDEEKLEIARRYLLPRQLSQAGLKAEWLQIPDETIAALIRRYTREAGVRELERTFGRLCRKVALQFAEGTQSGTEPISITATGLPDWLGPERFFPEDARRELPPGVAAGLAWTESGGDVLYVEALLLPDSDQLLLTGQLGDVMKESARAAQSCVIAHGRELGIERPAGGVHLHVPAGAVPKDGPSAGITMAAALASLYSGCPIRSDTAMTGEITLTGLVLPVGGIREKVLAARRAGLRRIILPAANEKDLAKLPPEVREELEFVCVSKIEEVLQDLIPQLAEQSVGV
ncbi:endopeptidase La [bacterium]|nr:endopeptidase La [bacterium]